MTEEIRQPPEQWEMSIYEGAIEKWGSTNQIIKAMEDLERRVFGTGSGADRDKLLQDAGFEL